ncbi:MAG TPA: phosphatase PAP2 family protein [Gemmatimonadaceae bacterium]|nr:phosphatase PAP2 family protein [Gemmatimonadaceae bacterium]
MNHEKTFGEAIARILRIAVASLLAMPCAARAQDTTSSSRSESSRGTASDSAQYLSRRELIFGGGAVLATALLVPFDRPIQRSMQTDDLQDDHGLRRTAKALAFGGGPGPFIAGGALYVVGLGANSSRLAALGVHLTEGVGAAAALNALVKGLSGRALPNATTAKPGHFSFGRGFHDDNGSFVSFPSGHTAASFAAAAVITDETSSWDSSTARIVAPIAYSSATLVALSRLYENVHWASDLPIGAAIGVLSGKAVVLWEQRHPLNWLDRHLVGVMVAPAAHGMRLGASFPLAE